MIESPISDLKLDAIGVTPREDARPDHRRDALRRRARHPRRVLRRRLHPRRPRLLRAGLPRRGRGRARKRSSSSTRSGSPRPRRSPSSSRGLSTGSGPTSPSTSTGTTTSASPRPRRSRRFAPGATLGAGDDQRHGRARRQRGSRARSRSRSARSTASSRTCASTASARSRSGYASCRATSSAPWKPVTGETLFRRESGAVASQFHDPPSIEPYSSELVATDRGIVLGKKSGLDSIRIKAAELGLDVPEERSRRRARGRQAARRREAGLVTDDEFRAIVTGAD